MKLFNKIKNKLSMLALFGLLFQLTMPVYQTYVFANENEAGIEASAETGTDTDTDEFEEEVLDEGAGLEEEVKQELDEEEVADKEFTEDTEEEKNESDLIGEKEENTEDSELVNTEDAPEELNLEPEAKREPKEITENIITGMRLMYKDGTIFEVDDLIEVDEDLRFELDWKLKNDHGYQAGDYFEFELPKQITVHNSLDGFLGDYGSYTVDMDGNVKFTFNEKIEQESEIHGTFWMDTKLIEQEITTTEETIELIVNGVIVQKIIVNIKPKGGQAISKSGQPVNGDFNTQEVEWTVIVNTKRESLKNAEIDDPILAGQELILDSIKLTEVEVDLAGNMTKELAEVTGFTNNSTGQNLNIELGNTNKAYKLTFKTKLLEKDFKEGTTNYENTAYLKSDGIKDAQAGGSVSVSRPKSMEKTSLAFDKENRWIEWTVNANFTEQNLKKGDVITDEFTFTVGKEEINDVFEIKLGNIKIEQVDKFDAQGKVTETSDAIDLFDITREGNKVTYKLKEASSKAFIITYKTELKEGAYINKDGKITNKIDLNGKTATGSQGVYQQVGKKRNAGINYEDKTIDWTITINADKQDLHNFVLTDNFAGSGQKLVPGSIEITPDDSGATITPNADEEGFTINFGNIKETYTITYQTKFTYDFEDEKTPNFKNGVKITYDTKDESGYELGFGNEVEPNKETKSNGAKNGKVDQQTKEITWAIDINYNQLKLTDAKLTDAIPDNQSLINDSVKIYETSIAKNGKISVGKEVTGDFTIDTDENKVNVTFNGKIDKSYRIVFKTKDKDGIYNGDEVYNNTAKFIPREGEVHNLTANVTLPNQGEFIGKTGTHNKENWTADWTIDVNKSLSTTSDFTVTDDLGEGQILLKDTIKVTKAGVNEELEEGEGKDYKLTVDGNKFTIYFPGKITEAFVITYSSYILAEETMDITNKAEIKSNDVIKGTITDIKKINVRISTGGGTGEGKTGSLVLEKFEADSERALQDVAFSLVKTIRGTEIVVREGTTNEEGKLEWNGLQYGDYTLKETIPYGYLGDAERTVTLSSKDPEGIKTLPIENTRKTGIAKIIKVDAHTGETIKGAKFKITNQTTKQEYELETAKDGVISKEVPFGEYIVEEIVTPAGYRATEDIENITVEIGKTAIVEVENVAYVDLPVQKLWYVDEDKQLPESVTVNLLKNGEATDQSITLNAANNWKDSFKNLDKYTTANKEIKYTIEEEAIDGYIVEQDGYNLTNIQTTEIIGEKIWLDDNSPERPDLITIHLLANGEKTNHSLEVSGENDWKYQFTEIPKYDKAGKEIEYSVEEEALKDYETTIDGFVITNLRVGKVEVSGEKIWKDAGPADRPESIEVILTRNVKGEFDSEFKRKLTVTPDSEGVWEYTFDDLPEFDEKGQAYTYTVKEETTPTGYESSVDGYDITNLRVGTVSLSGVKTWKDGNISDRPDSITVNLLRNNVVHETKVVQPADPADEWTYTFSDLAEFDEEGIAYEYRVSEEDVPGYATEFSGMNITNTRSEKKTIEITKGWLDDNSKDRPKSIEVDVYQNDELFKTVKVKASEDWTYELKDLEAYDEDGKAYVYTIEEREIKGYETKVNGFNLTNTRTDTLIIKGEKYWKDESSTNRPESIEVILTRGLKGKADESFTITQVVTPDSTDRWMYAFEELPAFDKQGVAYDYQVKENTVPTGYKTSVDGYDITNLRVGMIDMKVEKKWINDTEANRPEKIIVDLMQNGKLLETVTLSKATGWMHSFIDLDEFDQEGKAYEYTIEEKPVKGYETSVEETKQGFVITNTYRTPEKPQKPQKPGKPGKPEDSKETLLPITGESNNLIIYLLGGILILVGLVIGRKRIKD